MINKIEQDMKNLQARVAFLEELLRCFGVTKIDHVSRTYRTKTGSENLFGKPGIIN
jgi:hypothetical protein